MDCSQDVVPAVRLASVAEETELTRIHRKDSGCQTGERTGGTAEWLPVRKLGSGDEGSFFK